jgi:hypothetical protein
MIGVPVAADIAGRLRFLADFTDHRKIWHRLNGRAGMIVLDFAEAFSESQMLTRREVLVAEEDDAVLVQRVADFPVRAVLQRIRQVHVENFSTNSRGDRTNINGGIFHCDLGR